MCCEGVMIIVCGTCTTEFGAKLDVAELPSVVTMALNDDGPDKTDDGNGAEEGDCTTAEAADCDVIEVVAAPGVV